MSDFWDRARRLDPSWVYVGAPEAAILAGVSLRTVSRWIASGELAYAVQVHHRPMGRCAHLYKLSEALALAKNTRR